MELGKIYFFTATILNWIPIFQFKGYPEIIISSFKFLVEQRRVRIYGYVIMPNHIHLLWKPVKKNLQLSFMKYTAQQIKFRLQDNKIQELERFKVNSDDRQYQIWQKRPKAFEIWSREMFEQKLDYIHNNPVQGKWMLSSSPLEYSYSSAAFYEGDNFNHEILTHYRDDI